MAKRSRDQDDEGLALALANSLADAQQAADLRPLPVAASGATPCFAQPQRRPEEQALAKKEQLPSALLCLAALWGAKHRPKYLVGRVRHCAAGARRHVAERRAV